MGDYMITNRPAGVDALDPVDNASWTWVADLATQAVIARQADLVRMVNEATSSGTVDDFNNV